MNGKEKAATIKATAISKEEIRRAYNNNAKVEKEKNISKVINFFVYNKVGSSLSVSIATSISRGSVCWYLHSLLECGILRCVGKAKGSMGRVSNLYMMEDAV